MIEENKLQVVCGRCRVITDNATYLNTLDEFRCLQCLYEAMCFFSKLSLVANGIFVLMLLVVILWKR
jgi:hypothetical protein